MTTVTTIELAEAIGVSKQAIAKRARKQQWTPTGERKQGGGNVYDLDTLPLSKDERYKVNGYLAACEIAKATLPVVVEAPIEKAASTLVVTAQPEQKQLQPRLQGEAIPLKRQGNTPLLTEKQKRLALAKYELFKLYAKHLAKADRKRKTQARDEFILLYQADQWRELRALIGEVSWKTIESWKLTLRETGDPYRLADTRGTGRRGSTELSIEQQGILRIFALHPNKLRISHAIRYARLVMRHRQIDTMSDATCRRYLNKYRDANFPQWIFFREGEQALEDECGYTIKRDWDKAEVGDIMTADGHVLNFQVINPWTGKPCRPVLILWYDCKSNMPLGWELMPTENTAAIHAALRRAILALGKMPKVAYLDNGRAFKGKHFTNADDFENGQIAGLYARLGIATTFAWPYHGQSKTVERFFGTLLEMESVLPTYIGNSIGNKPARMHRGERLHRQLWEKYGGAGIALTMEQAHQILATWFDMYASRPQRGHLKGKSPLEVFEAGRGPGVDQAELMELMWSVKKRSIRKDGIEIWGEHYYHPALYGRRDEVVVRFDLNDRSCLYLYEQDGAFLCKAEPQAGVHPAARFLGSEDEKARLEEEIATKQRLKTTTVGPARKLLRSVVLPEYQQQMEQLGLVDTSVRRQQLPAPVKSIDSARIARELAELEVVREEEVEDDYVPELVDESVDLSKLSGADLYEALIERAARGTLTTQQATQMSYYEDEPEYHRLKDYFEEYRVKVALIVGQKHTEQREGGEL